MKEYCEFYPHKLGIGGVANRCKPCTIQKKKAEKNPEKQRAQSRRYYSKPKGIRSRNALKGKYRSSDPVFYMWKGAKDRAFRKCLDFTIEITDISVPEFCPVLGMRLTANQSRLSDRSYSMSLDRVDNTIGYVPGNVAVISNRANKIKRDASVQELEAIVAYMKANLPAESQQVA